MRRLFKMEVSLYTPGVPFDDYCIESFETVRTGRRNRILHFGMSNPMNKEHVDWLNVVLAAEMESLIIRTAGIHEKLDF